MTDTLRHPPAPRPVTGSAVRFEKIRHRFGATTVIDTLDLTIEGGELVALLGPSGCGKSTLLRILAGLQPQTGGTVTIGGEPVDGLSPRQRGVGIVFQNYALFPHMRVLANVAYGLEANGMKRAAAERRAMTMLERVRMDAFATRHPRELSGGQQQRVALARTLAVEPRILLLDEPFAALDKSLRLDMQIEIRRLQRELNITTIMVTHDQEEAMSMADRVAVLHQGRLEQFAAPTDLYDRPATPFVAGFVGTANLLAARLVVRGEQLAARIGEHGWLALARPACDPGVRAGLARLDAAAQRDVGIPVLLAVRPEQWEARDAASAPDASDERLTATVQLVLPLGPTLLTEASLGDALPIKLTAPRGAGGACRAGDRIVLRIRPDATIRIFAAPAAG
ncbi:ABC transporter ATP-binding protein [Robbsia sp. Bb-Pol-6]|uniref:ABC transporter ATP-binding protein n=1 Tax=Robbsia betulipollinis TaxID=2981849 RepID=A0ABT3ZJE9_9BURK|nr:ABC transporter ATP-binding protein [Robbsia betulipollinis]MCY0386664.1 ABC transporter ATP-binding protein [Robbsia betulipollinis]